jgi:hypothetical protein
MAEDSLLYEVDRGYPYLARRLHKSAGGWENFTRIGSCTTPTPQPPQIFGRRPLLSLGWTDCRAIYRQNVCTIVDFESWQP